ncbi:MAG: hypothetical protein IKQ29_03610 [Bacilli bacterium]|nr:hypothetical protein [Bacilli bacterium]
MNNNDNKQIQQTESEKVMKPIKITSILVSIAGVLITIFFIFMFLSGFDLFISTGSGVLIIALAFIFVCVLLGVYLTIIPILSYLFLKLFSKIGLIENKSIRVTIISIICIVILILSCLFFKHNVIDERDTLDKVINNHSILAIYNDKIYYKKKLWKSKIAIYSMDLDGNNKKLIVKFDNKNGFYYDGLVYKDEFIFNTGNADDNTKILNLNTGEFSEFDKKYSFKKNIYDGNKIIVDEYVPNYAYDYYVVDLDEKKPIIEYRIMGSTYPEYRYYNLNNDKLYGIESVYEKNGVGFYIKLYINNELIDSIYDYGSSKLSLIYADDNYFYIYCDGTIIKYDINNKSIVTNEIEKRDYRIVRSNDLNDGYAEDREYLYIFDKENLTFKKIYEKRVDGFDSNDIYYNNDKIFVFYDNYVDDDIDSNAIIYYKSSEKIENYDDVDRYFIDYDNNILYMIIRDDNGKKIEKIDFNK